jgi:hypothetical protein
VPSRGEQPAADEEEKTEASPSQQEQRWKAVTRQRLMADSVAAMRLIGCPNPAALPSVSAAAGLGFDPIFLAGLQQALPRALGGSKKGIERNALAAASAREFAAALAMADGLPASALGQGTEAGSKDGVGTSALGSKVRGFESKCVALLKSLRDIALSLESPSGLRALLEDVVALVVEPLASEAGLTAQDIELALACIEQAGATALADQEESLYHCVPHWQRYIRGVSYLCQCFLRCSGDAASGPTMSSYGLFSISGDGGRLPSVGVLEASAAAFAQHSTLS